jgi:hypothetical protein
VAGRESSLNALLAFFRRRLITLAGNNLAMRVPWEPEADCGVGIGGQAFELCGKLRQIAANVC